MSETIKCHECGHGINRHNDVPSSTCSHSGKVDDVNWVNCDCSLSPQDIASAAIAEARRELENKIAILEGGLSRIASKAGEWERKTDEAKNRVPWWNLGDIAKATLKRIEAKREQQPATVGEMTDAAYGNLDLDGSDNTVAGEMRNAGFDGGML